MPSDKMVILHGNDLGIWVCGIRVISAWFIEAICPEVYVGVEVRFGRINNDRRRYFLNHQALPFYYGDCGQVQPSLRNWHLFGMGEAADLTFMKECDLSDLKFPVRVAGIVLIVDKAEVEEPQHPAYRSEFEWVKSQSLPFVIAAVGCNDLPESSIDQFRKYFELETNLPIVAGPAMRKDGGTPIDPEHARRVVEALQGGAN